MNEEKFMGYSVVDYLDEVANKFNLTSDNQIANKLGVTRSAVSQYRSGSRAMDDYCAMQIAAFLKINPMLVIAAANERREKSEPKKEYWRNIQICLSSGGQLMFSAAFFALVSSTTLQIIRTAPQYILC